MMDDIISNIVLYTGGICISVLMVLLTICCFAAVVERLKKK